MIKKILNMMVICVIACYVFQMPVYASDNEGEEYITISVDAADDNGNLKYAIDTDDPAAFSDSNEFIVPAGTSHTIYVKDVAGNITSQVYDEKTDTEKKSVSDENGTDEQKINLDLEIGGSQTENTNDNKYIINSSPESGSATVASKTKTDGSDNAEKIFYTFTTKEGEVLYLVIDQSQGTDNVYLLDTVSIDDLRVLADGQAVSDSTDEKEDNLLSSLTGADSSSEDNLSQQTVKKSRSATKSNAFIILLFAVVGGAVYYYLKVYKNKKNEAMDAMDAMDLDEFESEDEEEELEFDYDDSEKEKYLERLINEDEDLYDADPEEYAMSHITKDEYSTEMDLDETHNEEYSELYEEFDSEDTEEA